MQGVQGIIGPAGADGMQGEKGDPGPAGPKGTSMMHDPSLLVLSCMCNPASWGLNLS